MKVSGVIFDDGMDFSDHLRGVFERSKVRLAVLARVAGSSWGLEAGAIRQTHDSLLVSLLRYGLILMGSGLFECQLASIETKIANVVARRITGVGRSARLMTLHIAADIMPARNLFIVNCVAPRSNSPCTQQLNQSSRN